MNQNKTIPLKEWSQQFSPEEKTAARRENDYSAVVSEFKKTRNKLGLTQQQLADKTGVDRTVVAKIETGARNTTVLSLMKFAEAMDKKLQIRFV